MLTLVTALFFQGALSGNQLAQDLSSWYGSATMLLLATLLTITVYGFVVSRGGEPLFGGRVFSS